MVLRDKLPKTSGFYWALTLPAYYRDDDDKLLTRAITVLYLHRYKKSFSRPHDAGYYKEIGHDGILFLGEDNRDRDDQDSRGPLWGRKIGRPLKVTKEE